MDKQDTTRAIRAFLTNPNAPLTQGLSLYHALQGTPLTLPPHDPDGTTARLLLRNALNRQLAALQMGAGQTVPPRFSQAKVPTTRHVKTPLAKARDRDRVYVPILDDRAFTDAPPAVLQAREAVLNIKDPTGRAMAQLQALCQRAPLLPDGERAKLARELHNLALQRRGHWETLEKHFLTRPPYPRPPRPITPPAHSDSNPTRPLHTRRIVGFIGGSQGKESPTVEIAFVKTNGQLRTLTSRLIRYEPKGETLLLKSEGTPRRVRLYTIIRVNDHPTYL